MTAETLDGDLTPDRPQENGELMAYRWYVEYHAYNEPMTLESPMLRAVLRLARERPEWLPVLVRLRRGAIWRGVRWSLGDR